MKITFNDELGTLEWTSNSILHREGGPAVIYPDGSMNWYLDGRLHRTDGPAVVWDNGTKKWVLYGEVYNRCNQPSTVYELDDKNNETWWGMDVLCGCGPLVWVLQKAG